MKDKNKVKDQLDKEGTAGLKQSKHERKRAKEALRESEDLFRDAFENHAAVKLLIDPDTGNILDANKAAIDYYGWSNDQLQKMKIWDINILSPDDVKKEMEKARTLRRTYFEFRHRRADGSIRDVAVFSNNITTKGKAILHSIIHDITDRKETEKERDKLIVELKEALSQVKVLSGLLPICASCKRIKNEEGQWEQIEVYIRGRSEAEFSHSICPQCLKTLYPEYSKDK
ncbi:MAG: putative diguanylate cyclase YdaM [Syntrophorhabdus sp. PtaU1.Bin050]|nr:MAG: putative diguanylate cyclase YdaM [Syntrophorhabdus sp. PtaU1.Bin050]